MKAAVYYEMGGPEVFRYEDVPDPVCGPTQVLIRTRAVSIEGGDVLHRARGPMGPAPYVVGYQSAGEVIEVGAEVHDRTVGQFVVASGMDGSHAELRAVEAQASWLLPEGIDPKQAACVPIAAGTAHDCLFEFGRLQAGETVLIQAGASAVGLAAIQLAKRAGATVIATASSQAKLDRLAELGLDHGINYTEEDFVARVLEFTGGLGANLAIDTVGGTTLQGSIDSTGFRGRIIFVGSASRDNTPPDPRTLQPLNKSLIGHFFGMELMRNNERAHAQVADRLADVARGDLRVIIDSEFPLAEAVAAHRHIESRSVVGRVLLIP